MKPNKGEVFERINPATKQWERLTYTGTRREVKGVEMDFFTNEKGEMLFFYPSEVTMYFVKV